MIEGMSELASTLLSSGVCTEKQKKTFRITENRKAIGKLKVPLL